MFRAGLIVVVCAGFFAFSPTAKAQYYGGLAMVPLVMVKVDTASGCVNGYMKSGIAWNGLSPGNASGWKPAPTNSASACALSVRVAEVRADCGPRHR